MLMVVVCKLLKVTVLFMGSTQLLKQQQQQYGAKGKELGTNFMQQQAYSLGLQSHQKKVSIPFQVYQSPDKRSLVDSEELQSYTPLPLG